MSNLPIVEVVEYPNRTKVLRIGSAELQDYVESVDATATCGSAYRVTLTLLAESVSYRKATREEVLARDAQVGVNLDV
jgi:hypothetical protein